MSEQVLFTNMGKISRIRKGKKPHLVECNRINDDYLPYVLIENFSGCYSQFTNDNTCVRIDSNDIVIVWDGERAGLVSRNHEGYLGSTLAAISIEEKDYEKDFVFFTLQHYQKYLRNGAEGTGVPHLSKWVLETLPVVRETKQEQQKIASILTSVDEVIEKTQSQINKLQDLKKATMNELLTRGIGHTEFKDSPLGRIPKSWEVCKFEEIVADKTLGTTIRGTGENNLPLIKMGNLQSGEVLMDDVEEVQESEEMTDLTLSYGDFLFNTRNTPDLVGKVSNFLHHITAIYDNNILRVRFDGNVDPIFLGFLFNEPKTKIRLKRIVAGTTSVAAIYWNDLSSFLIPLASISEQKKICSYLLSHNETIGTLQSKKKALESLKKSLMQDLLTGKVRVQVNLYGKR